MGRKESNQTNKNGNYTIKLQKSVIGMEMFTQCVFFQATSMDVDGNNEGLVVCILALDNTISTTTPFAGANSDLSDTYADSEYAGESHLHSLSLCNSI